MWPVTQLPLIFLWRFYISRCEFFEGVLWGCYEADSWVIGQIINTRISKWLSNSSSKVVDTDPDNHPDLAFNVSFGQNFPPQPKIFFPWKKKVWLNILNWFWVKISGRNITKNNRIWLMVLIHRLFLSSFGIWVSRFIFAEQHKKKMRLRSLVLKYFSSEFLALLKAYQALLKDLQSWFILENFHTAKFLLN